MLYSKFIYEGIGKEWNCEEEVLLLKSAKKFQNDWKIISRRLTQFGPSVTPEQCEAHWKFLKTNPEVILTVQQTPSKDITFVYSKNSR